MSELHPLAQSFASVADEYERGRPDYPQAAVGAFAFEFGLSTRPPARVLDLAAGTGKLSRALVAGGFDVVAVEPLESLRTCWPRRSAATASRGHGRADPLPDAWADAVTVADAFHWFDHPVALAEIRASCAGGGLAVISMVARLERRQLGARARDALVRPPARARPFFDGPPWHETVAATGGFGPHREVRVTTQEPTSPERVENHLASMSWLAALDEGPRAEFRAQVRAIIGGGEMPPVLPQHVNIGLVRRLD